MNEDERLRPDLRMDYYIDSVEPIVVLTHLPTGITVFSAEYRSINKNKAAALKLLAETLSARGMPFHD